MFQRQKINYSKLEIILIEVIVILGILFMLPAIYEKRVNNLEQDRINNIAKTKSKLEQYFNKNNYYPVNDIDIVESKSLVLYHPSDISKSNQAGGFYLETFLVKKSDDAVGKNEDPGMGFNYKIYQKEGKTVYRVCGGTEMSCENK